MPRQKKTPIEIPGADDIGFDVPEPSNPVPPPAAVDDDADETDDVPVEPPAPEPQAIETPEQRRLMRAKRIAKAEEEQLRRLTRQYPVIAHLVAENLALKKRLEQKS